MAMLANKINKPVIQSPQPSSDAKIPHGALALPAVPVLRINGTKQLQPVQREFTPERAQGSKVPFFTGTQQGLPAVPSFFIQKKANKTGLPDRLKAGVEHLSGFAMDDVKVHYNSAKPATLQAHAYAQGTEIHIAPGQEKHLPHEAWHVAQQKQGRVKPTLQMKGVAINGNDNLPLPHATFIKGIFPFQLKITMKDEGTPGERSSGDEKKLSKEVEDTKNSGSRGDMVDTIAQLQLSIAARKSDPHPNGINANHQARITLEENLLKDLETAYAALPKKTPKKKKNNLTF